MKKQPPVLNIKININGQFDITVVFSVNPNRGHYRSRVVLITIGPSSSDSTKIPERGKGYDL